MLLAGNTKIYPEEYFSSADVGIYVGNTLIDEVNTISFQLQENVQPISGYASRTYDAIARGKRKITGSFSINFKRNNYLNNILQEYISKKIGTTKKQVDTLRRENYLSPGTGQDLKSLLEKSENDEEVQAILEKRREEYWEAEEVDSVEADEDTPYFFGYDPDNFPGSEKEAYEQYEKLKEIGFTIEIQYGDKSNRPGMLNNEAVRKIYGVQLAGLGQRINLEGQPVREVYSFMAKDLSR